MVWRNTLRIIIYAQKNKLTGQYIKAPFQETVTQFHPWGKLYIDNVGPLPTTEEGYKYCHFSR